MAQGVDERTGSSQLAAVRTALSALIVVEPVLLSGGEQLEVLVEGLRLEARLHSWLVAQAARLEAGEVAWREYGTSTATWLAGVLNLTRKEAGRLIGAGQGLRRFPIVGDAARSGVVLPGQAEAITAVLDDLPPDFAAETVAEAESLMVELAGSHTSADLRRLTARLVEVLDPVGAEAREAVRLERQDRLARRDRHLVFHYTGGSVEFSGSLPVGDAEPLIRIIDSYAAKAKRGIDRLDPMAEHVTPGMRRADGLVAMVTRHTRDGLAPGHGGDRPRIVVTMSYDKLVEGCIDARLVGTGEGLPAWVARRMLCDADLMPAVLGGRSEVLDVGRAQRLVTPAIRAALELRDGGCVFPGCEVPARDCDAHHRRPWWAGGDTSLANLALACPHHHRIVEDSHNPNADRWRIDLTPDGLPCLIPPQRVDPNQKPRLHARFLTRRRT